MSEKEFSLEQSEELIANLKSGAPSEFEQLRSTLNLLAHVPEISPIASPPMLPSSISAPVPVIPIKSSKTRRTVITSIVTVGFFASASLAAAAVTGIGPAQFVKASHQTAKFVRSVVGAVSSAVTGSNAGVSEVTPPASTVPGPTANPSGNQDSSSTGSNSSNGSDNSSTSNNNNESDSESKNLPIPAILGPLVSPLVSPIPPEVTKSNGGKDLSSKESSSKDGQTQQNKDGKPQETKDARQTENESPRPTPTLTAPPASNDDQENLNSSVPTESKPPKPIQVDPSGIPLPNPTGDTEQSDTEN